MIGAFISPIANNIWNISNHNNNDEHTNIEYFQFKIVNVHKVNCLLSTNVPLNSTQELGNGLLASSEVSA
jgi:hypothetical protein